MRRIALHLFLWITLVLHSGQHPGPEQGDRLMAEAMMLLDSARYDLALERSQQALQYFQAPDRRDMPRSGEALMLLGSIFLEYGDFSGAVQQYEQALALLGEHLGPKHLLTAKALNGMGECMYKMGQYEEAERFHRKALAIRERQLGHTHEQVADSYNNLGNCYIDTGRYAEAILMHQKALDIKQRIFPENHPLLASSFNNLANCHLMLGEYAQALPLLQTALRIRLQVLGPEHPRVATLYNNLGNCFADMGRADQALLHYQQALAIRRTQFGPKHPAVANTLENIGGLFFDSGDYVTALDYFREAYHIQQSVHDVQSVAVASLQHKIGQCLEYEGDYEEALRAHLASAKALLATFGPAHPTSAKLFNNLGNCYMGQGFPSVAEEYYVRALSIFRNSYLAPHPDIAKVCNNLGAAALAQRAYARAQQWFEEAASTLCIYGQSQGPEMARTLKNQALANAGMGQWSEAFDKLGEARMALVESDPMAELEVLYAQGDLLCERGLADGDVEALRLAADVLYEALQRSDSLRLLIHTAAARQRWAAVQYPALANAVQAHFALWEHTGEAQHLQIAFELAEKGKGLHLLETLRKEQAERFAGVPEHLLAEERDLNWQLNRLEKDRMTWAQMQNAEGTQEVDVAIADVRKRISTLTTDMEARYPEYTRLKQARTTATPEEIRAEWLKPGQAVVEYMATDSCLFAFLITRSDFTGVRIPLDFPLMEWVAELRSSIQDYHTAAGSSTDTLAARYALAATRLYAKIVAPLEAAGLKGNHRWLIIPDGALAYVPFEALLRNAPQNPNHFKTHDYLLHHYCVSYAYSVTQLHDLLRQAYTPARKPFVAFAPRFDPERDGLSILYHNREEARTVAALFQGDVLEGPEATRDAFLAHAAQYRILLLATHGKAGSSVGDLSYLAFASRPGDLAPDTRLYVRDLYQHRLPAELVALSACETSVGEYKAGEGVISLAKGFFHAGVRSIVATLWSVDDAKHTDLMRRFFEHIRDATPKDEALRNAKRAFLKAHPHGDVHPAYWAAAVTAGDMRPLSGQQAWSKSWWLIIILLLPAAGLVWRRYRRRV